MTLKERRGVVKKLTKAIKSETMEQFQDLIAVKEVHAEKYAQLSGLSLFTVNNYCRKGILTCRKFNKGKEISDYTETRNGFWMVDTTKSIGE